MGVPCTDALTGWTLREAGDQPWSLADGDDAPTDEAAGQGATLIF